MTRFFFFLIRFFLANDTYEHEQTVLYFRLFMHIYYKIICGQDVVDYSRPFAKFGKFVLKIFLP